MLIKRLLQSWFSKGGRNYPVVHAGQTNRRGVEQLSGSAWLVRGRHGSYVASDNDIYIGRALIRYGEFSELEWKLLQRYCGAGHTVVEVGANIGAHTVTLSKAVGRAGRVIAIEPQPVLFRTLCANLALNDLMNTVPHQCGCGSAEGTMSVPSLDYDSEHNFGGISLEAWDEARPDAAVVVKPLDDLLKAEARVDLIKIDVEGMESDVLNGGRVTIDALRPVLYVENDRVPRSKALIETLMAMGYRMWWHAPPLFNPDNYYGEPSNVYGSVRSFNMLCLHRSCAVPAPPDLVEVTDAGSHPLSP